MEAAIFLAFWAPFAICCYIACRFAIVIKRSFQRDIFTK